LTQSPENRRALYARYVSDFKGTPGSERSESSWRSWADRRYAPLLANVPRDAQVLELGCGPGLMLAYLRDLGFEHLQGVDISEQQVALARSRGCDARARDVFDALVESPGGYDLIIAIDFVEHFSKDELHRLLPLVRKSLRPGGVFLVQTPNGEGLFSRQVIYSDLTHITILTPMSLEQLFRIHGFEAFTFRETGPVPKNLIGVARVAIWALLRLGANIARAAETGKRQRIWTENMICLCRRSGSTPEESD
jgi:SAM-dependent methyltransferase